MDPPPRKYSRELTERRQTLALSEFTLHTARCCWAHKSAIGTAWYDFRVTLWSGTHQSVKRLATGWTTEVRFLGGAQTSVFATSLLPNESFGSKAPRSWSWLLTPIFAEVFTVLAFTSRTPIRFHGMVITHRNNITFHLSVTSRHVTSRVIAGCLHEFLYWVPKRIELTHSGGRTCL
jgi:hypothetical protein